MHYFEALAISGSLLYLIGIPLGSAIGVNGAARSVLLSLAIGQVATFFVLTLLGHPLQEMTRGIAHAAALGWFGGAPLLCKRTLHHHWAMDLAGRGADPRDRDTPRAPWPRTE
jgi:hypothetical protein